MSEILDFNDKFDGVRLNEGSQVDSFLCESDIVILVGIRASGKSFVSLAKNLMHIHKPHFRSVYFRRQVKDSQGVGALADKSREFFSQFGRYLSSLQSMTWEFNSGARTVFANYSASETDFQNSIQGIEYDLVVIDEVTQITENRFNAIFSNLRNTKGDRVQIFGSCNADPKSWILNLIKPYIDPETGYHKESMNGVEMFFYQFGDTMGEAFWGRTKKEVLKLAEPYLDEVWSDGMEKYGTKEDLIQSITVFEGKMEENTALMESGGVSYMGKLLKGSLEMRARYARANWKAVSVGDSLISVEDLDRMYSNSAQITDTNYASMDISGEGQDNCVLWIWQGFHITNVYTVKGLKAKALLDWTSRILDREGVEQCNFVYDRIGVGFAFTGFYDDATAFVSNARPSEDSMVEFEGRKLNVYTNAKAEAVGHFLDILHNVNGTGECGISIDPTVLDKTINGITVRDIINEERNVIRWRTDRDGIYQVIDKKETRRILGRSPDYILSMIYRVVLENRRKPVTKKQAQGILNKFAFNFMR